MESTVIEGITPNPGLFTTLGMSLVEESSTCVRMDMPITKDILQPFGLLHGGATLALLETAASWGATIDADLANELPFGVESRIRHVKSAKDGTVHGRASLQKVEDQGAWGRKLFWEVVAVDDVGDILSKGVFVTKTVSFERLEQKKRQDTAMNHGTCLGK